MDNSTLKLTLSQPDNGLQYQMEMHNNVNLYHHGNKSRKGVGKWGIDNIVDHFI